MTWRHFDGSLGCLVSPALDELATQLSFAGGLSARERAVIIDATRESLYTVLHTKVSCAPDYTAGFNSFQKR